MSDKMELFENAILRVETYLKVSGLHLLPENNDRSITVRLKNRWYFIFALIWLDTDLAAEIAWVINGFITGKSFTEITYIAPCATQCILANVKVYFFSKHEILVNDLIKSLRMLQGINQGKNNKELEKDLLRSISFLTKASKVQCWLNIIGLIGFAILPFVIMGMTYLESGRIVLVLPFYVLYPFDVYDTRIWPFQYVRLMISATLAVFMVFGADSLYYACCTFIQTQFRFLKHDMERIITGSVNENKYGRAKFWSELGLLVKRHKEIIRCVDLMERIYSKSTLFNVVTSSFLICLTGFNVTAIDYWPLMMPFIAFFILVFVQIFLFCYFGDTLMKSSMAVSDGVYNSRWYNADATAIKDLLFIMTRAQRPCKLTAHGFSDIHLGAFTKILSTSWSYFALLKTMNKEF